MDGAEEALLRFSIFVGVFVTLALAEMLVPRRTLAFGRARWIANLGLSATNTLLLRLSYFVVPALTVLAAAYVESKGWGLLPVVGVTGFAAVVTGFVVLDLAIYAQHVAMHFVPALWRLHRVHHADPDFDVSTGVRFHPLEILVSQAWKVAVVLIVGVPALAVLAFEIALNATSMFSHANVRLPGWVDGALRTVLVTPDMHRIHHSTELVELNSNFAFNLSLWDRLFGTYRETPMLEQCTMPIGLPSYPGAAPSRFGWLLQFPFARGPAA